MVSFHVSPTSQGFQELLLRGLRVVPKERVHGHHHPRGAEPTLGAVALGNPLLEGHMNERSQAFLLSPPLPKVHIWQLPYHGGTQSLSRAPLPWLRDGQHPFSYAALEEVTQKPYSIITIISQAQMLRSF